MDDKLVLDRIDVRDAAVIDGKVQCVQRDGAAEPVMRRARMQGTEFTGLDVPSSLIARADRVIT